MLRSRTPCLCWVVLLAQGFFPEREAQTQVLLKDLLVGTLLPALARHGQVEAREPDLVAGVGSAQLKPSSKAHRKTGLMPSAQLGSSWFCHQLQQGCPPPKALTIA